MGLFEPLTVTTLSRFISLSYKTGPKIDFTAFETAETKEDIICKCFNISKSNLLKEIKTLGLLDNAELDLSDKATQDSLIKLFKDVFDLSVINGKESAIFKSLIQIIDIEPILSQYNITLQYDAVTNWDNEIDYIATIFQNVMTLTGNFEDFDLTESNLQ